MIPRANITAWRSLGPWAEDFQIEQDLVICRAVVELYTDPVIRAGLAMRGATALYKLTPAPASRYSEDIDMVQRTSGPIGPLLDAVRSRLDHWLGAPQHALRAVLSELVSRLPGEPWRGGD